MSLTSWLSAIRQRPLRKRERFAKRRGHSSGQRRTELLEDRTVPVTVDLFTAGATGIINGAVFEEVISTSSTGTGKFDTFVQLQAKNGDFDDNGNTEQGVNYDSSSNPGPNLSAQYDEGNSSIHNRALLLSAVPIVDVGGTLYREFFLDVNQLDNRPYLSMNELKVSVANSPSLQQVFPNAFELSYDPTFGGAATPVFNLDVGSDGDSTLRTQSNGLDNGSGKGDVRVLIPNNLFNNTYTTPYVYLFSAFGYTAPEDVSGNSAREEFYANDGFEEWAVKKMVDTPAGDLLLRKTVTNKFTGVIGGSDEIVPIVAAHHGDSLTYRYEVTISSGAAFDVNLSDDNATPSSTGDDFNPNFVSGDDGDNLLEVGETWLYEFTTTAPLHGQITSHTLTNTATVTATEHDPTGTEEALGPITDTATVQIADLALGELTLVKTATNDATGLSTVEGDPDSVIDAHHGDEITYTIVVSYGPAGSDPLTVVTVLDSHVSLLGITPTFAGGDADALLEGGEVWTYTFSRPVSATHADLFENPDTTITNVATVSAVSVDTSSPIGPVSDDATVNVLHPSFTVEKSFALEDGGSVADDADDVIHYTVVIANTGDETLTGEVLSDSLVPGLGAPTESLSDNGNLDVGETWTFSYDYAVSQADLDNNGTLNNQECDDGVIENIFTASFVQAGAVSDHACVPVTQDPSFTVAKSFELEDGGNVADDADDVIHYTVIVSNTGNLTLTGETLSDSLVGTIGTPVESLSDNGNLDVGETWTFSYDYEVSQADLDNNGTLNNQECDDGFIENIFTASFVQAGAVSDHACVPVTQDPSFTVEKSFELEDDGTAADEAGDVIHYTVLVSNTGNLTLTGETLSDSLVGTIGTPVESLSDNGNLDVGETWTFSYDYEVSQADLDNNGTLNNQECDDGFIENIFTASFVQAGPVSDHECVPVDQNPDFTVTKVADVSKVDTAGDVINYTIAVVNTGNITLTGYSINDPLLGTLTGPEASDTDGDGDLDVDETWIFTGSYTVQQSDIDNNGIDSNGDPDGDGDINNTVTVDFVETAPKPASEDVTVQIVPPSLLTNTEYCSFDYDPTLPGNQFRLLYQVEAAGIYRLNSSNPGQFYYNAIISGTPGDAVNMLVEIPYPFVTQGANPIHVYSEFDIEPNEFGYCLTPLGDVSSSFVINTENGNTSPSGAEIIRLTDYDPRQLGSEEWITVAGVIPASGWTYVTVHLDYGLKATSGWRRDTVNPEIARHAVSAAFPQAITLNEPQSYEFFFADAGASGISDAETGQSVNEWKKSVGVGGFVGNTSSTPIAGATVTLRKGTSPTGTLIATTTTDADGYYWFNYKHTGSATTFTVRVKNTDTTTSIGGSQSFTLKANGYAVANFSLGSYSLQVNGELPDPNATVSLLDDEQLSQAIQAALNQWRSEGLSESDLAAMAQQLDARIVDLAGSVIGQATPSEHLIELDRDAGGYGWNQVDLVEVMTHEIGHLLDFDHGDNSHMSEFLSVGKTFVAAPAELDLPALLPRAVVSAPFAPPLTRQDFPVTVPDQGFLAIEWLAQQSASQRASAIAPFETLDLVFTDLDFNEWDGVDDVAPAAHLWELEAIEQAARLRERWVESTSEVSSDIADEPPVRPIDDEPVEFVPDDLSIDNCRENDPADEQTDSNENAHIIGLALASLAICPALRGTDNERLRTVSVPRAKRRHA